MPETAPYLADYALVTGKVASAPLDLAMRMEQVYLLLRRAGWRVAVKSVGTDFGPVPVPRDQPIELYLKREAGPFTAADAQEALRATLKTLDLGYSPTGAWLREVSREVIEPTLATAQSGLHQLATLATIGLVAYVAISLLPRGRR